MNTATAMQNVFVMTFSCTKIELNLLWCAIYRKHTDSDNTGFQRKLKIQEVCVVTCNVSSILCHTLGRNMSKRSMSFKRDDGQLCDVQTISVLGHSVSNQHKKILTLTDFNETWFLHGDC